MNVTFLQLRYFQTVARLQNFSRAAEELSISQPSLSRTISSLEQQFGVTFFDRVGREVRLNHFGKALHHRLERVFGEFEQAQREIEGLKNGEQALIEITIHAGTQLLPDLLSSYRLKYPMVRFRVSQRTALEALEQLERGEVDLCLTTPPLNHPDIATTNLLTEEIMLAVPPDHRLAGQERVSLNEFVNEDFIALKSGYNLRDFTDAYMRRKGFNLQLVYEGDNPASIPSLIKARLGIGFVPAITWKAALESSLVLLHLEDAEFKRTLGLSWRTDRFPSQAELNFRAYVIQYFSKLVNDRPD